jgi:hypothetical protein
MLDIISIIGIYFYFSCKQIPIQIQISHLVFHFQKNVVTNVARLFVLSITTSFSLLKILEQRTMSHC